MNKFNSKKNIFWLIFLLLISCKTPDEQLDSKYNDTISTYLYKEKSQINDLIIHQCEFYTLENVPDGNNGICIINKLKKIFQFEPFLLKINNEKVSEDNEILGKNMLRVSLLINEIKNFSYIDYENKKGINLTYTHQLQMSDQKRNIYVINFPQNDYDDLIHYFDQQKIPRKENPNFIKTNENIEIEKKRDELSEPIVYDFNLIPLLPNNLKIPQLPKIKIK